MKAPNDSEIVKNERDKLENILRMNFICQLVPYESSTLWLSDLSVTVKT